MTEPIVDLLADEWQRVTELCSSLQPQDWTRPTDCPGWSVADQLAHIIGTESMLAGRADPRRAEQHGEHVKNRIGELNEAWVESYRTTTPEEMLSAWNDLVALRLEQLRSASPEQFEKVGPSPVGEVPYREFMSVRLMDCWVHEQDIRRAVDRPGHLRGPIVSAAIDRFAGAMAFVVGKKAGARAGTTVVFDLHGDSPRSIAVAVGDTRAKTVDVSDVTEPTVTLRMDVETWWVLALGRRSATDARAQGSVTVEGDEELGAAVLDNLAFMI